MPTNGFAGRKVFIVTGYCQYYYRPQRSWGEVIFSQAPVILFTGGGLPQCMLGYHPPSRRQDRPAPPPGKADPPARQTPPGKADPPCAVHAGRYGQQAGGMHPTEMHFLSLLRGF